MSHFYSAAQEDIPFHHCKSIRPEWSSAKARSESHIFKYSDNGPAGRFKTSLRLKDTPQMFWTSIYVGHDRNVPAKWRLYVWYSEHFEYEIVGWRSIPTCSWTLLPSLLPAFYTHPGKIYIEIDIPSDNDYEVNLNVRLCGFQKLLPWAPRWDYVDEHGNRILSWIPDKDSDITNEARLYHCIYDRDPPFEPNMEVLPHLKLLPFNLSP